MKKILAMALLVTSIGITANAQSVHKVVSGDSMWKIAVKYEVGLSELKTANPHIENPELIYPGQTINIPGKDATVTEYEQEVIRLVNEVRKQNGLSELKYDWELARVARYKSQDMKDNGYFAHNSPVYG